MSCFVCGGQLDYFCSKVFNEYGLGNVTYDQCRTCHLVLSRTHRQLSDESWTRLNREYHAFLGSTQNKDDPRWMDRLAYQAQSILTLRRQSLLPYDHPWVDYGCGDGKLADMLAASGVLLNKYDKYMRLSRQYLTDEQFLSEKYDLIVSTSVFEHVRSIAPLNEMNEHLSPHGVLAIHTLVAEEIPKDPSWFYFLPPHSAFFTNSSMSILFKTWGFEPSIYDVKSRMWYFFKPGARIDQSILDRLNSEASEQRYFYKAGFMDYWKVPPYRDSPNSR